MLERVERAVVRQRSARRVSRRQHRTIDDVPTAGPVERRWKRLPGPGRGPRSGG
jgi:hypothetical protein